MHSEPKAIYLGIDVGSVTTKMAALDADSLEILDSLYLRTSGDPLGALRHVMERLAAWRPTPIVRGAATTGSGRTLAARLINTDLIKNEITTHSLSALRIVPNVRTVVEIGGQDSKIIIIRKGLAADFAMNTVCAAGTGSFLDQQAGRLGVRVEDMGELALSSTRPAPISGRCTVFAETDMIHKQQIGTPMNDIIGGLCRALVKNFLAGVAGGKVLREPVVFQGGVAANSGIVREFERQTGLSFRVSPHYGIAGAHGAALFASMASGERPEFLGFAIPHVNFRIQSFECRRCEETCTVLRLFRDGESVAFWNDRCGIYSRPGGSLPKEALSPVKAETNEII